MEWQKSSVRSFHFSASRYEIQQFLRSISSTTAEVRLVLVSVVEMFACAYSVKLVAEMKRKKRKLHFHLHCVAFRY